MIQFKYKTNSLSIANVTERTFVTKFSACDHNLLLLIQEPAKVYLKLKCFRSLIAIKEDKHQSRVDEW